MSNIHTQSKKEISVKEIFTFIVFILKRCIFALNYELGLYREAANWRETVQLQSSSKSLDPLKWGDETGVPPSPEKSPALQFYLSPHLLVLFFLHFLFDYELFRTQLFHFKHLNGTS